MTEKSLLVDKWKQYCHSYGLQPEGAAARLGLAQTDYNKFIVHGMTTIPDEIQLAMSNIIEQRDIIDSTILPTKLFKELEKYVKDGLNDKVMITASAPTGQGKTSAAKLLAKKFNSTYHIVLSETQREKKAAIRNFIRDLGRSYHIIGRSFNNERRLIESLRSDRRSVLIIDEAQRLISEDWGYFKVLQDVFDNVPNLSILLLGNFRFYDEMFYAADRTVSGILDEEQFLRRISVVSKLSRITKADVKLWCEFNHIKFKNEIEYKQTADFFKVRAGMADLEMVRKEIIKNVLGRGRRMRLSDFSYTDFVAIYKKLHTQIKFKDEDASFSNLNYGEVQSA